MKKLFKDSTDNVYVQIFRYILAGSVAYAVDYTSLIVFVEVFRVYYLTAAAAAFLLGLTTSYILNVAWVFSNRTIKNRKLEILIFASIGIVGLLLNHYCIWFFTESMKLHYIGSKFISTILVFIVNFSTRKYFLFR
ncbi:MAG: GtrA family protein [Candidatus Tantalella remota]|nr:GtrA family protein [Candidatus Tantalella remota]